MGSPVRKASPSRKAWQHNTGSRHQRGYGAAWDRLRLTILERDRYLCQCDQCKGGIIRPTAASQVDHITPKAQGGTDDPSNLRAISKACHERVTIEQKGHRPKLGCDVNGNPSGGWHA
jgi:5-methylcytosine-specific restriction protein A